MSLLIDGFTTGLGLAVWLLGALLAIAIVAGCITAGVLLVRNAYSTLAATRPAWWLRARRSIHRMRR